MWINLTGATPDPAQSARLRAANEARAAHLYQAARAMARGATALGGALRRGAAAPLAPLRARAARVRMARALHTIEPHILHDIGLSPGMIETVADRAAGDARRRSGPDGAGEAPGLVAWMQRRRRARRVAAQVAALQAIEPRLYKDIGLYPRSFRDVAERLTDADPGDAAAPQAHGTGQPPAAERRAA